MRRLVYAPKAYAWVDTEKHGLFDLTPYLIRGSVNRLVNAPSTAELEFRNPNMMFTEKSRTKEGPYFRPMDRITIWLERIRGFPVQTFTGYIDSAPYLQIYPGPCTITASCTLKRLHHTYWDMGLNYTSNWLARQGWEGSRSTGQLLNTKAEDEDLGPAELKDGSIGQLLYATLTDIAEWPKDGIHIEELPPDLVGQVTNIWTAYTEDSKEIAKGIETMVKKYIGEGNYATGSLDSGGGGGGAESRAPIRIEEVEKYNKQYRSFIGPNIPSWAEFFGEMTIRAICEAAGFSVGEAWVMFTISRGEAGGGKNGAYPGIQQPDPGDGMVGYGLFQNTPRAWGSSAPAYKYMMSLGGIKANFNPVKAALIAHKLFVTSGGHFEPWGGGNTSNNVSKYLDTTPPPGLKSALDRGTSKPATGRNVPGPKREAPDEVRTGGKLKNNSDSGNEDKKTAQGTRFDAIVAEANRLHRLSVAGMPYSNARPPSDDIGYDCSSSCAKLMQAAGYKNIPFFSTIDAPNYMIPGRGERLTFWNNDHNGTGGNSVHIFAEIDGRDWGTGGSLPSGSGPSWGDQDQTGFKPYRLQGLDEPADVPTGADTSSGGGGGGTSQDSGASWEDVLSTSKAAAFVQELQFPGLMESFEANALTGARSLMNDKPLYSFIEQLSQAAMRSFQSLPNGDFYAFYPDYFGNIGNRQPYWDIDDIEILDGQITLNDEALRTHVFAVGDTQPFTPGIDRLERTTNSGIINIFNKAQSGFTGAATEQKAIEREEEIRAQHRKTIVSDPAECMRFLQKYGARPHLEEATFVRSRFYEAFLAWTLFDQMWSRQFLTEFEFTFMPEIFPGGLVSFSSHNVQCYVDQVTHNFDYEGGFTTTASLSAPATLNSDEQQSDPLSFGLVRAGAEQ